MARGSILSRPNKDGTTTYSIKYRAGDGRQVKAASGPSRRQAERALTAALADVDTGRLHSAPSRDTLGDYLDRWLVEHSAYVEVGTLIGYETDVRLRIKPALERMRLNRLTAPDVRRLAADLRAQQLAPKTINNTLVTLKAALNRAVKDGLITHNPAAGVTLPTEHREMDYLRLEEIPVYLAACHDRYRPLAELLLATGVRIGEALALTWGDVDWRSGAIVITKAHKRSGVGSTKGDRSRRVEVGARLVQLLADRRAVQAEQHADDDAGRLLFPGQCGHLDRSHVSRVWHKQALKGAGLRQTIRLHDLRHSAAASWLACGLPMIYVQRQLGHRQVATTIDLYGHLEEGFLRDAAARAEAGVWASGTAPVPRA